MVRASTCCLFAVATLATAPVCADESPSAFADCALITDGQERLACYDRLARRETSQVPATKVEAETVEASGPDPAPARSPEPIPTADPVAASDPLPENVDEHAPAAPSNATVAAMPPGPSAEPEQQFGMNEKLAAEQAVAGKIATPPQPLDEITASVTDLARQPHGEWVIALDNGQVWAEEFASRGLRIDVGDTVTIKKRRFQGYRLVTASGRAVAVERLR